jgi:hypothetical protein
MGDKCQLVRRGVSFIMMAGEKMKTGFDSGAKSPAKHFY